MMQHANPLKGQAAVNIV